MDPSFVGYAHVLAVPVALGLIGRRRITRRAQSWDPAAVTAFCEHMLQEIAALPPNKDGFVPLNRLGMRYSITHRDYLQKCLLHENYGEVRFGSVKLTAAGRKRAGAWPRGTMQPSRTRGTASSW